MLQKIHCDLLNINGVDWSSISDEQINCIISTIHEMELMGTKGELFGFVGTADIDNIVGGFFAIQFPTEFLSYGRDRTAVKKTTTPAERVFFVLLPKGGRILLQNRRFQVLPINMETVHIRLKEALAQVFRACKIGPLVSLTPTSIDVQKSDLLDAYESSNRVSRLQVNDPDPRQIPEGFVYYNPERDRNAILRDSRLHDYPQLRDIDLTAKKGCDLRNTHLGQDLVHATRDNTSFSMEFNDRHDRHQILRKLVKATFEFHADIDGEKVSKQTLHQVVEILEQEAALNISIPRVPPRDLQLGLFDAMRGDSNED